MAYRHRSLLLESCLQDALFQAFFTNLPMRASLFFNYGLMQADRMYIYDMPGNPNPVVDGQYLKVTLKVLAAWEISSTILRDVLLRGNNFATSKFLLERKHQYFTDSGLRRRLNADSC